MKAFFLFVSVLLSIQSVVWAHHDHDRIIPNPLPRYAGPGYVAPQPGWTNRGGTWYPPVVAVPAAPVYVVPVVPIVTNDARYFSPCPRSFVNYYCEFSTNKIAYQICNTCGKCPEAGYTGEDCAR